MTKSVNFKDTINATVKLEQKIIPVYVKALLNLYTTYRNEAPQLKEVGNNFTWCGDEVFFIEKKECEKTHVPAPTFFFGTEPLSVWDFMERCEPDSLLRIVSDIPADGFKHEHYAYLLSTSLPFAMFMEGFGLPFLLAQRQTKEKDGEGVDWADKNPLDLLKEAQDELNIEINDIAPEFMTDESIQKAFTFPCVGLWSFFYNKLYRYTGLVWKLGQLSDEDVLEVKEETNDSSEADETPQNTTDESDLNGDNLSPDEENVQ
jgi:hypothetical protein